jgi:hypothetical protein
VTGQIQLTIGFQRQWVSIRSYNFNHISEYIYTESYIYNIYIWMYIWMIVIQIHSQSLCIEKQEDPAGNKRFSNMAANLRYGHPSLGIDFQHQLSILILAIPFLIIWPIY